MGFPEARHQSAPSSTNSGAVKGRPSNDSLKAEEGGVFEQSREWETTKLRERKRPDEGLNLSGAFSGAYKEGQRPTTTNTLKKCRE